MRRESFYPAILSKAGGRAERLARGACTFEDIASRSEGMAHSIRLGERAAASTIPVLIEGESGVGKELFARAIQSASDRADKPFITVDCGVLPVNLVESVLFGHERGSFTGATERHKGKFLEANGGTLFLDEIGELPLEMQVKLLRALQAGEIDPIGATRPARVDVRVISATNQSLSELVKHRLFREDLFYRLNVLPIKIPPLRARREDIPDLARRFTAQFAAMAARDIHGISNEALSLLVSYDWPGNVRELENAVFRAVVLANGVELTVAEFPQIRVRDCDLEAQSDPQPVAVDTVIRWESEAPPLANENCNTLRLLSPLGEMRTLDEVVAETIRFALVYHHGQITATARALGIGRSTLYRKMISSPAFAKR